MADTFRIIPYVVRSAGTDVPPEEVQAAINSLATQTTIALNSVASDPTGPAGGDLSGTYPNPSVAAVHATSGTMSGVTVNSSPVGQTTPAAGAFTTLTATTPVAPTSGGTGRNALTANAVLVGEGSSQVNFAAPGAAGGMLISQGAAADPAFANNPTITGGSVNNAPVGNTTPNTGAFTTLSASSGLNSTAVGNTTPSIGAFTTLAASGAVTGTGFTNLFASPPSIGNTAANSGAFTTLSATGAVSGAGFTARFATPGPIGNTSASTGAFTTLSSTGAYTPSSTNGIVGTTTNDNANAGSIGEYQTATTTGTSITSGTPVNVTSVSLTAGDWDVSGTVFYSPAATTVPSQIVTSISTVSATNGALGALNQLTMVLTTGAGQRQSSPVVRISVASTTTVFLVASAVFTVSTMTVDGLIRARRVR